MVERPPPIPIGPEPAGSDHDVDLRAVFKFAGALVAITVVVMGIVWGLSVRLKHDLAGADPLPSPLPEASAHRLPPGPRLEESPPQSLAELRAREEALLGSWAWVDRNRGVAQIPIERAIEIIAGKGLPAPPPPPSPGGGKK
jgi:hypothetical protein